MLFLKIWRKQAFANKDRLVETMQQQQANNQEQELQEQEDDFGLAVAIPWEMLQDTYPESRALLTRAFSRKGLRSEEKLQRLAFWLVRSKANLSIVQN